MEGDVLELLKEMELTETAVVVEVRMWCPLTVSTKIQTIKLQQYFIYHYLFSRMLHWHCEGESLPLIVYQCQQDTNNKSPAIFYL